MNAIQKNIVRQIMALCGTLLGDKKTPSGVPEVYAQLEAFVKAEISKAGFNPELINLSVEDRIKEGERRCDISLDYDGSYLIYSLFNKSLEEAVEEIKDYISRGRLAPDIEYHQNRKQQAQSEPTPTP